MVDLDRWAGAMAGWRTVRIDSNRCLPRISPRSQCDACVSICPEGALSPGEAPTVRDCSTCGLCAAVCKADAIGLDNPSDEQLVQRFAALARKGPRLSLTCMAGPAGPEQVGCLGRLTPELLLAGAACGFTEIDLVAGPCETCRYARGKDLITEAAGTAEQILRTLGNPCRLRLITASDWKPDTAKKAGAAVEAPVYEERRAFLLSAFGLLREFLPLAPSRPAAAKELTTPQMSRRREILRWVLGQLQVDEKLSLPWGEAGIRLTSRCYHCGICQRLCPNGAIQTAPGAGLTLDPQRCHTCGLCTAVCPMGSLSPGAPYTVGAIAHSGPVALGEVAAYHCAECGEPVEATGEGEPLCLPCAVRSQTREVLLT